MKKLRMKSIIFSLLGMFILSIGTYCTIKDDHIVRADTVTIAEREPVYLQVVGTSISTNQVDCMEGEYFSDTVSSLRTMLGDSIAVMLEDSGTWTAIWLPMESPKDTFIEVNHNVWYNEATWDIIDSTYYYDVLQWEINRIQEYVDWLKTKVR